MAAQARAVLARPPAPANATEAGLTGWPLAATAMVLMTLLLGGEKLLADPDTQWHIAAGRTMLQTLSMPYVDTMSHSFAGHPWIAKEWLSQVFLAAAHALGGWAGVGFLAALATTIAFRVVMLASSGRDAWLTGIAAGMAALAIIAPTVVARPHALVFPIVALWTAALMRGARAGRPPWYALVLLVIWANMHAGFTMGLVIAGAFGLDALLRAQAHERMRTMLHWLAFGIACILATMITPYGAEPLRLNFTMAQGNEAMQFIDEWRSPGLSLKSLILSVFSALCIYALAQNWRVNAARMLLLVFLTYTMLRHERFIMVFGIVAPMVAFGALGPLARRVLDRFNLFQGDMLPNGRATIVALCALAIATTALAILPWRPPVNVAPRAALAAVPEEIRQRNVFNSYDLGGFLAFSGVPTFIDGRTDQLFLGGFITRTMRASAAKTSEALEKLLDEYKVGWAIVNTDQWESLHFPEMAGWQEIPSNDAAKVRVYARIMEAAPQLRR